MGAEEDAVYTEALHRITEAKNARGTTLDLRGLGSLNRLPPELEQLSSLQEFDLSQCRQLGGNLAPLAGLTSLHTLELYNCVQLSGSLASSTGRSYFSSQA
jgi:hypothetical protein